MIESPLDQTKQDLKDALIDEDDFVKLEIPSMFIDKKD